MPKEYIIVESHWPHKEGCSKHTCICLGDDQPDPICDCGAPGWACECYFEEIDDFLTQK